MPPARRTSITSLKPSRAAETSRFRYWRFRRRIAQAYAQQLFARFNDVHVAVGRPHWLIVDEAHHALPVQSETIAPLDLGPNTFLITTRPQLVAPRGLASIELVIAVGDDPGTTIESARAILGLPKPASRVTLDHAHTGTAVAWKRSAPD
jgi:hypothetical protein